ncbi:MAG: RES family NAD+ phosphorylase [Bacteroidota bacterium]
MQLFRIGHTMHSRDLTGEGARLNGGRWNHPGIACIYSSGTRSLSLLEYTCHVKKHLIPRDLSFVTFEAPEHSIKHYTIGELPGNWKNQPPAKEPRDFGSKFLTESAFLLYAIPSVVIEEEMNYIINPNHPDSAMIKIMDVKDYAYDLRLKAN